MPNPNRPAFGDVIDETWGQIVADEVVRRYASVAERDSDLVGFTPAQLAGQVVAIVPAGPLATSGPPWLEVHDGVGWRPSPADCSATIHPADAWPLATGLSCPITHIVDADPYGMASATGFTLCASGLWLLELEYTMTNQVGGQIFTAFYQNDHTTMAVQGPTVQNPGNFPISVALTRVVRYGKGQIVVPAIWSAGAANLSPDPRVSYAQVTLLARTG